MMRRLRWDRIVPLALLVACWLMVASRAVAQLSVVPAPVDMAPFQAKAQAALDAASAAQSSATAACKATPAVPPSEMVGGTAGTSAAGCRPADAAQPRITRAAIVTTDANGGYAVTWRAALPATPVTLPIPINTTAEPVVCNVTTTTMTGATGRCWYARTLPSTLTLLSALVSYDLFGASAAGISVQVLAIPPTQ